MFFDKCEVWHGDVPRALNGERKNEAVSSQSKGDAPNSGFIVMRFQSFSDKKRQKHQNKGKKQTYGV